MIHKLTGGGMRGVFTKTLLYFICFVLLGIFIHLTPEKKVRYEEYSLTRRKIDPPFFHSYTSWVDSVFNSLGEEEKIAQLLMVGAYPDHTEAHYQEIDNLISKYNIGGLIFFSGTPYRTATLVNRFQKIARTPLLMAVDGEWGLAMRIDSTVKYPKQMTLGAIQDEKMIYDMGSQIAAQMKRLGLHINFAPVVDVNNNPDNPVINSRSFGEDRANVSRKGILYMAGMQDNHILAVAKHFPGHGDTDTDSHLALPLIPHPRHRLDSLELFPFKEIINSGVGGVMIAHLNVPFLDPTPSLPSTLSPLIVDSLLKKELGFKGLVFTDAMNMRGVSEKYSPVEAGIKALLAGNDILLMPHDIPKLIVSALKEIKKGNISQEEIDRRCKKVLAAKYWAGLNKYDPVNLSDLSDDLNKPEYRLLSQKLYEASLTLLENKDDLIPLKRLDTLKIASVLIGDEEEPEFGTILNNYLSVKSFFIPKDAYISEFNQLYEKLKDYNLVIIGLMGTDMRASKNYGISSNAVNFIDSVVKTDKVILDLFSNPYSCDYFKNLQHCRGLLVSYEDNEVTERLSAEIIFGSIAAGGRLPVTAIQNEYPVRSGIATQSLERLRYSLPVEAGVNEKLLYKIDSVAYDAINQKAMPGCQILAARNGIVFYQKSFGKHTYKGKNIVKNTDLYDLASVTKIAASMPAIMNLCDNDRLDINEKISKYLPYLDTTDKKDIKIKDILLHQARLKPWIPFYINTLEPMIQGQDFSSNKYSDIYSLKIGNNYYVNKNLKYRENCYSKIRSEEFPVQVAEHLYINRCFIDTIYNAIASSELNERDGYKYSDLGFYWFYRIIENLTNQKFEDFLDSVFYSSIGASSLCFNPLRKHSANEIAPTENDLVFRKQLVQGYVHDMGAAMLGGVCGHAGLFGNANDLAKVMQLYLNKGEYGNERYLNKRTVEYFTSCRDCDKNRRGLGFDKAEPDTSLNGPTCKLASPSSFGHTGFTGTMVWADPEYGIVYVFLSNRVYPDVTNIKLLEMDVRTKIQQTIYEAIMN